MYGGDGSDVSSNDGNTGVGYDSNVEEPSIISTSSDGESSHGHGGNGTASDDEKSAIYNRGNVSSESDTESLYSGTSLSTTVLAGGAASNSREYNQSWFIEKHKINNKSKSKDYSRLEELVDIIYEALNEKM